MGLFTNVVVEGKHLPLTLRKCDWQTKDVVEPTMDTLIITKAGRLLEQLYDKPAEDLNYHGDMNFYTIHKGEWVEFKARFTDGQLESLTLIPEIKQSHVNSS
jgi:hypothetical protein